MIDWQKCARADAIVIHKITRRVRNDINPRLDEPLDLQSIEMDITATHISGCPLDLEKLMAAPDFDFAHDVLGIRRHINRKSGELMDCFIPRCAQPEAANT